MDATIADGLGGIVEFEEPINEAAGEAVSSADPIHDFKGLVSLEGAAGCVVLTIVPNEGAPVVDGRGSGSAEGGGGRLEVGEGGHCLADHFFEGICLNGAEVLVNALDLEAKAGGEVFLVTDHDINVLGDFPVDLAATLKAAEVLPEGGAVIEIVANDGLVLFSGFDSVDDKVWSGIGKGGEDAASMEPTSAELAEDFLPIDIADAKLAGRGMTAIGSAAGSTYAEAALGKVEAVADGAADAIVIDPFDEAGVDPPLEDKVLNQSADRVVGKGSNDGGAEPEAAPESPGDVVLPASLPGGELAGGMDAPLARIEAKHDFSEGDAVVGAGGTIFNGEHGEGRCGCFSIGND